MSRSSRIYIGHLSDRTRTRDVEHIFGKFGRVRDIDMKYRFAFIKYYDQRDAEDAIYDMHRRTVDGSKIIVEWARERRERGPSKEDTCFNCGKVGHWANDCREGDWKDKCYNCGKTGHKRVECRESPKRRDRLDRGAGGPSNSHSRSRSPRGSPPPPRREPRRSRERSWEKEERRSRDYSPKSKSKSPSPYTARETENDEY